MEFAFASELWLWPGDGAWHFVSLPEDVADEITDRYDGRKRGFGSLKVHVHCGTSQWDTSIFPDTKRGTYVLPVKKQVRSREGLEDGDLMDVHLTVVED